MQFLNGTLKSQNRFTAPKNKEKMSKNFEIGIIGAELSDYYWSKIVFVIVIGHLICQSPKKHLQRANIHAFCEINGGKFRKIFAFMKIVLPSIKSSSNKQFC